VTQRKVCDPSRPSAMQSGAGADLFDIWAAITLIGVYIVQDGVFAWVNETFRRDLGYRARDLIGRRSTDLIHADDRLLAHTQAVRMLHGTLRTPYEFRYLKQNGEVRWALETVASIPYRGRRAVLGNFMDITARKEAEAQLAHRAFHDPLTDLPNRVLFLDRLTRALARRDRHPGEAAVLYLDLDGFKAVNDSFGHHAGDLLLTAAARRLSRCLRPCDTVARLGGDEFAVLLEDILQPAHALRVAEDLIAALCEPFIVTGHSVSITSSAGVALSRPGARAPEELLREADAALYVAKARGKACAVLAGVAPSPLGRAGAPAA
jgi:diguanylate cyclase (GGDEF)-like protein/PAS domain S-box-containing protein